MSVCRVYPASSRAHSGAAGAAQAPRQGAPRRSPMRRRRGPALPTRPRGGGRRGLSARSWSPPRGGGQAPRQLSIAGARIFARQLREAVGYRHDVAVRAVGTSRACPFDLQALVPVPAWVLALGPDEPQSLAWLWEHWGTTEALRQVTDESGDTAAGKSPRKAEPENWQLSFWSADWTPWRALHHLALGWPVLRFACRPTYDAS